jgi:hypothetical protein
LVTAPRESSLTSQIGGRDTFTGMSHDNTALLILPAEAGNSLLDVAELEYQASLQLLLDRACWVTGALSGAIALGNDGEFTYRGVSGESEHEPGRNAAIEKEPLRECLAERWTVRYAIGAGKFSMAVPIVRDETAMGVIELISDLEFTAESSEVVSRIADLIVVTVEHHDAARRAEQLEFREEELELPSLWHAPEASKNEVRFMGDVQVEASPVERLIPEVGKCAACGFPISPTRSLCVECEQNPESAATAREIFTTAPEESWLSAHGYTIASALVTAITVAIILWLKH